MVDNGTFVHMDMLVVLGLMIFEGVLYIDKSRST